ncbi:PTS system mannose/fructose/sorbose family transporter subunit IID, partial [Enterobacter roggenkampii]|uniref:PTS system mannose/fructose/sorbose family transporter subunit IID n=1 Tax=Enterobacter roggenkampii TaxID=1812935 RepID=UPI0021C5CB09
MEERKLTRKDLRRCWRAWMMHNLSSMSFERLESFGFCLSMLPVAKKLYPDPVQRTEMLRRHASFYNTEPQIGAIVNGMALGLEEKKANGEPIDGETISRCFSPPDSSAIDLVSVSGESPNRVRSSVNFFGSGVWLRMCQG